MTARKPRLRWRTSRPARFGKTTRPSYQLWADGVECAVVAPTGDDAAGLWFWHTMEARPLRNTASEPTTLDAVKAAAKDHVIAWLESSPS